MLESTLFIQISTSTDHRTRPRPTAREAGVARRYNVARSAPSILYCT